ncbi:MAG TPA: hypothetical protein VGM90_17305 [Kofleriaceae bacterium]|jgi:hypothetical protein
MRTSLLLASMLFGSATVLAAPVTTETVVHDTTTHVSLALNEQTVLCSSADYSATFLKVLIPQLAGLTLLDHQNLGAGAPCVAAGQCEPGRMPEDIIDASSPSEGVDINVKAVREDVADADAQTCTTTLIERVHVTIRGFEFVHERTAPLGSRAFSDCGIAAPAPAPSYETGSGSGSDVPADESGRVDETPSSGGCNAGGGVGSGGLLVGLALVAARRRRRP